MSLQVSSLLSAHPSKPLQVTSLPGFPTIAILVFGCADGILRDLNLAWAPWTLFWGVAPRALMWVVAIVTVASGVEYFHASRKMLARYF